jgi:hypothetical protein
MSASDLRNERKVGRDSERRGWEFDFGRRRAAGGKRQIWDKNILLVRTHASSKLRNREL